MKNQRLKIKVEFDPRGRGEITLADGRRAFVPIESMIDTIDVCQKRGFDVDAGKACGKLFWDALKWSAVNGGFEFVPTQPCQQP